MTQTIRFKTREQIAEYLKRHGYANVRAVGRVHDAWCPVVAAGASICICKPSFELKVPARRQRVPA